MSTIVKAFDIKNALAKMHKEEFFMTECKNGPTQFSSMNGLMKFDAVAIYKSWTRPCIRIYEIKVSRSDFLADIKFRTYLPYCHEMYFAVPVGLIDRNELPADIGLVYYNPEKKSLSTKLKATYRNIAIDPNMLMYIIMNRLESQEPYFVSSNAEYFNAWIMNKMSNKELGWKIRNKMVGELSKLQSELESFKYEKERREELKEIDNLLRTYGYGYFNCSMARFIKHLLASDQSSEADRTIARVQKILDEYSGKLKARENIGGKEALDVNKD
jgi:hypothetical protein